MSEHRCQAEVWGSWNYFTCSKPAKYQTDGVWYCGWHEPGRVAARDAKSKAKRDERWAARQEKHNAANQRQEHRNACEAACEGIPTDKLKPGLVGEMREGLEKAAHALEITADFVADALYPDRPDTATVQGIKHDAKQARALLAKLED